MSRGRALACLSLVTALAAAPAVARAEVPETKQALIVMRVIAYDKRLDDHTSQQVRIAVVHGPGAESLACASRMREAFDRLVGRVTVLGRPIGVDTISITALEPQRLARRRIPVAYVCRGVGNELPRLVQMARAARVLTVTDQPGYVERGLSIALVAAASRVRIEINLEAARAEGAQLGSQLLRLSKVVRR
jgi:hypothetical protein